MFKLLSGYNEDLVFNFEYDGLVLPHYYNRSTLAALSSFIAKNFPAYNETLASKIATMFKTTMRKRNVTFTPVHVSDDPLTLEGGLATLIKSIDVLIHRGHKKIVVPCPKFKGHFPDLDEWSKALNERYGKNKDVTVYWFFSNHFKHFSQEMMTLYELEILPLGNNYNTRLKEEGLPSPIERRRVVQLYDTSTIIWRGNYVRNYQQSDRSDVAGEYGSCISDTGITFGNISANPYKLLLSRGAM